MESDEDDAPELVESLVTIPPVGIKVEEDDIPVSIAID